MYREVDLYAKVRRAVMVEGISERGAAKRFGIDRKTVGKMIRHSIPPGYQRKEAPVSPKLGPFVGITLMQLRFASFAVANLLEDFHLQDRAHAGRTSTASFHLRS